MAVIDVLASLEDVRPVHLPTVLEDPLYDFIDPEALDSLVTDEETISISFTVADYDVQINGDKLRIYHD
ncbi:HalOD1 output domain-containing protein [Natrarchaeobius oligotrophus]|uniref:HalOD1 output domain-containing protein n=1 Tax=Natrarchaeobius oligotrophus TaxID=3455743 RepID=UPI000F526232|nr:HalOD1 output domain-containing protein [Natrarchaeobius chitinivorans]